MNTPIAELTRDIVKRPRSFDELLMLTLLIRSVPADELRQREVRLKLNAVLRHEEAPGCEASSSDV